MEPEKGFLIRGEKIQIRNTVKSDLIHKVKWYNDPEVNRTLVLPETLELQKTYEWFERTQQDKSREEWIIETHDCKPIGIVGIKDINQNNLSGHLYIVIGEKDFWGKGIGYEAELLAIHYAFTNIKLHKVTGAAMENNPGSIRVINKIGFQQEGTLRDEYFSDNRYYDVHIYGILKNEFYKKHRQFKDMT
jgi:RimJ/RimL family protein N-acetyltransferase